MGKYYVVVDFGSGNTKISAYRKVQSGYELFSGSIFKTSATGLKNSETLQTFSQSLRRLNLKSGELYVILPEENESVVSCEADYPVGSKKELDGIVKNNLASMLKEDESLYYHSWRLVKPYSSGQGLFQIAAVRKEYIDVIHEIAEQHKLKFCYADLAANTVENLCRLIKNDKKHGLSSNDDASVIVEVGHRSVRVVTFSREAVIHTSAAVHNLYRMDKLILDSLHDLKNDQKINPELLKMNPAYALRVSQYEGFLNSLSADIIRFIKQSVSGEERYNLNSVYFTGGMYKTPKLVSIIKESFDVPCYAFPIGDYMHMSENCIHHADNKLYPSEDVFAPSLGALIGGF